MCGFPKLHFFWILAHTVPPSAAAHPEKSEFLLSKRKKCHLQICGRRKNGLRQRAVQYAAEALFFDTPAAPQNRLILRAFSKVQEGLRILVHPLSH